MVRTLLAVPLISLLSVFLNHRLVSASRQTLYVPPSDGTTPSSDNIRQIAFRRLMARAIALLTTFLIIATMVTGQSQHQSFAQEFT